MSASAAHRANTELAGLRAALVMLDTRIEALNIHLAALVLAVQQIKAALQSGP